MNAPVKTLRKLPIGIQSFEFLRSEGYLYVDKTELVYRLVTKGKPYFLSRPRRFGKSLLLSTLEAYFKGKKELFEGLAIEKLEQNWFEYPVLHLSLNAEKYDSRERLEGMLELQLESWEEMYGVDKGTMTYSGRFITIIRRAYEQTGRRVVVLVDEYDKPMLQTFDKPDLQEDFRKTLTAFYTVLKDADPYLQFVFITGVTKFAQMGIFSTLNQLNDISFDLEYNTLCGMTRTEIETVFVHDDLLASGQNKKACAVALAMCSGRRKAELCRFKVDDFKDENLVCGGALYKTSEPIQTKGFGLGKYIYCYTLAKKFKPYFDAWMAERQKLGIECEWLFPAGTTSEQMSDTTLNSWANTFSRMTGEDFYWHSLRHYFTTHLAKLGLPDNVIQDIVGWESADMVRVYKDLSAEEQISQYFDENGEIRSDAQKSLADL